MDNTKISNMVSYENWIQMLNRNSKNSDGTKLKPKTSSSQIKEIDKKVKRDNRTSTSEIWFG